MEVDPYDRFVFAAGDDGAIRAWSLRTGEPLRHRTSSSVNIIEGRTVHHQLKSLQVTEERTSLRLWISDGPFIRSFDLGVRIET